MLIKNCPRFVGSVLMLLLWLGTTIHAADAPTVYRCVTAAGRVEFRQYPCHGADDATTMHIKPQSSGWVPPSPEQPADDSKTARNQRHQSATHTERRSSTTTATSQSSEYKTCWKKRQKIEEINWRLRRGYTAAEGERLRQRRRDYQDYVREFCLTFPEK